MESKKLDVSIRPLVVEDIEAVAKLAGAAFGKEAFVALARNDLQDMFNEANSKPSFLVAVADGGEIVGAIGHMMSWTHWQIHNIFWVMVAPECQRRGVGTALVQTVLGLLRQNDEAVLVALTTESPDYFRRFGLETLDSFFDKSAGQEVYAMHMKLRR